MGVLSWFRERFAGTHDDRLATGGEPVAAPSDPTVPDGASAEWEEVPAYVPVDPEEHRVALVIASALAAGGRPESQMVVRSVKVANPEHLRVACIATALAAGALESSSFTIKGIYKRKDMESEHAA